MPNKENGRVYLNRFVSFVAGGLLVFAVMSFTVVSGAKKQNAQLTMELDSLKYEAGKLFADAKAQLDAGDYGKAKESLTTLFSKRPGSEQSTEGKSLLAVIEKEEKAADSRWASVLPGLRKKWSAARAAELRLEADAARSQVEKGLNDKIDQEWENAKDKVRQAYEAATPL